MDICLKKKKKKLWLRTKIVLNEFWKLQWKIFEQVNFSYIGELITDDGSCETELRKRIGMAKATLNDSSSIYTFKCQPEYK